MLKKEGSFNVDSEWTLIISKIQKIYGLWGGIFEQCFPEISKKWCDSVQNEFVFEQSIAFFQKMLLLFHQTYGHLSTTYEGELLKQYVTWILSSVENALDSFQLKLTTTPIQNTTDFFQIWFECCSFHYTKLLTKPEFQKIYGEMINLFFQHTSHSPPAPHLASPPSQRMPSS